MAHLLYAAVICALATALGVLLVERWFMRCMQDVAEMAPAPDVQDGIRWTWQGETLPSLSAGPTH